MTKEMTDEEWVRRREQLWRIWRSGGKILIDDDLRCIREVIEYCESLRKAVKDREGILALEMRKNESLREAQRWRSVEDELPHPCVEVDIFEVPAPGTNPLAYVGTGWVNGKKWWSRKGEIRPAYWKPRPAPPEAP